MTKQRRTEKCYNHFQMGFKISSELPFGQCGLGVRLHGLGVRLHGLGVRLHGLGMRLHVPVGGVQQLRSNNLQNRC